MIDFTSPWKFVLNVSKIAVQNIGGKTTHFPPWLCSCICLRQCMSLIFIHIFAYQAVINNQRKHFLELQQHNSHRLLAFLLDKELFVWEILCYSSNGHLINRKQDCRTTLKSWTPSFFLIHGFHSKQLQLSRSGCIARLQVRSESTSS